MEWSTCIGLTAVTTTTAKSVIALRSSARTTSGSQVNEMTKMFKIENFEQYKNFCKLWEILTEDSKAELKDDFVAAIVDYIENVHPIEFPKKGE
jgi:hypothetical protein